MFSRFETEEARTRRLQKDSAAMAPLFAAEEAEILKVLSNQTVIDQISKGKAGGSFDQTLLTLLEGIVQQQGKTDNETKNFTDQLKALKAFKTTLDPKQLESLISEFQNSAIKSYQRIASSAVSIIEGELSALTTGVPGNFTYGADPNEQMVSDKPFQKNILRQYIVQVDDVIDAISFMIKECKYVREALQGDSENLTKVLDASVGFVATAEAANLMKITSEYISIVGDVNELSQSLNIFQNAKNELERLGGGKSDRQWGSDMVTGMAVFGSFLCRVAEAEADLNTLNQVDGTGLVRRALTRNFSDIIILDQKLYPDNDQIAIPPSNVSAYTIEQYLQAYRDRQEELVSATEDQFSSIQNKFNRRIATAQRNINTTSETLLMPNNIRISAMTSGGRVEAIPTPEAFYSQTTGIDLAAIPRDLARRKEQYRALAEQYGFAFRDKAPAEARRLKKKAEKELAALAAEYAAVPEMIDLQEEVQAKLEASIPPPVRYTAPPPPPTPALRAPRSPSERTLDSLGIGTIGSNPRKRRKGKK